LRRPRPPNRTGGFPAYGSPVGGFFIETVSRVPGRVKREQPGIREEGIWPMQPFAAFDAVTSADSMRSVHTEASTHIQLALAGISAPCLAFAALAALLCPGIDFTLHLPAQPSLGRVLLPPPPALLADRNGTMRALTPRRLAHTGKASLLTLLRRPAIPPPTTSWSRPSPSRPRRCDRSGVATQASSKNRRLAAPRRRNGFVILRAGRSPPAAPHPASRQSG